MTKTRNVVLAVALMTAAACGSGSPSPTAPSVVANVPAPAPAPAPVVAPTPAPTPTPVPAVVKSCPIGYIGAVRHDEYADREDIEFKPVPDVATYVMNLEVEGHAGNGDYSPFGNVTFQPKAGQSADNGKITDAGTVYFEWANPTPSNARFRASIQTRCDVDSSLSKPSDLFTFWLWYHGYQYPQERR